MENKLNVILAEYNALRAELMYFVDAQRKNVVLLFTVAFGQAGGVLLNETKVDPLLLIYLFLFVVPILIFFIMVLTLENTAKILLVADYIHKGIKPQLRQFFKKDEEYFAWEEHKARSRRIHPRVMRILDHSKWWVFGVGIVISLAQAYWIQRTTGAAPEPRGLFTVAASLAAVWGTSALYISWRFNEADGEARPRTAVSLQEMRGLRRASRSSVSARGNGRE